MLLNDDHTHHAEDLFPVEEQAHATNNGLPVCRLLFRWRSSLVLIIFRITLFRMASRRTCYPRYYQTHHPLFLS